MEWTNSTSLHLIELYRERECLWNPTDDNYKSKSQKNKAWDEIGSILNCDPIDIRKKMESLLGSFRRERQKQENSAKASLNGEDTYKSTWFAFQSMQFLLEKFNSRETKYNEEISGVRYDPLESCPPFIEEPIEPPRAKKKKIDGDDIITGATIALKTIAKALGDNTKEKNYEDVFGEFVASKLKAIECPRKRYACEREIIKILYDF